MHEREENGIPRKRCQFRSYKKRMFEGVNATTFTTVGSQKQPAKKSRADKGEMDGKVSAARPKSGHSTKGTEFPHNYSPTPPPAKKRPPEPDMVTSSPPPAAPTTTSGAKKTSSAKALKDRPSKKFHDCKNPTTPYRHCNYWTFSGDNCGKSFCVNCLSSKYTLGSAMH